MKNLEEQILSYLDGSLSQEESAELLHVLSVSPEKRQILDEYLKMKDLLTVAQKPLPVPFHLEQRLAARLPVLSTELSYLSNDPAVKIGRFAPTASRFTVARRFLAAFFTGSPIRTSLSVSGLALLGGLAWFLAQSPAPSSADDPTIATSSVGTGGQSSHAQQKGHSANNITGDPHDLASSGSNVGDDRAASDPASAATDAESGNVQPKNVQRGHSLPLNAGTAMTPSENRQSTPAFRAQREGMTPVGSRSNLAVAESNNAAVANGNRSSAESVATTDAGEGATSGASVEGIVRTVDPMGIAQSHFEIERIASQPLGLRELSQSEDARGRLIASVDLGRTQSYRPEPGGDYIADMWKQMPVVGVGYELGRVVSIGVEGGRSAFSVMNSRIAVSADPSQPGVNRVSRSSEVALKNMFWSRLFARVVANPDDLLRFETQAGVGGAISEGVAPSVAIGTGLNYDLRDWVSLSFGVQLSATWIRSGELREGDLAAANAATGYLNPQANAQTVFTPETSLRLGLRVRP